MADKAPCKWFNPSDYEWDEAETCAHPLLMHFSGGVTSPIRPGSCHGCPCHEPEPAKDKQPDPKGEWLEMPSGDVCEWRNIALEAYEPNCLPGYFKVPDRRRKFCKSCKRRILFVNGQDTQRTDPPKVHDKP